MDRVMEYALLLLLTVTCKYY